MLAWALALAPARAALAQELSVPPTACTREFRTLFLRVRGLGSRALGPLEVTVRERRTRRVLRREVSTAAGQDARELDPALVPRGPARPIPADEREVPGAPGTPAGPPSEPAPGAPARDPRSVPGAPAAPAERRGERRVAVADDGMLRSLRARGDTLLVEVRAGGRAGRATIVVAPDRTGCHVVFVRAPAALVLR